MEKERTWWTRRFALWKELALNLTVQGTPPGLLDAVRCQPPSSRWFPKQTSDGDVEVKALDIFTINYGVVKRNNDWGRNIIARVYGDERSVAYNSADLTRMNQFAAVRRVIYIGFSVRQSERLESGGSTCVRARGLKFLNTDLP